MSAALALFEGRPEDRPACVTGLTATDTVEKIAVVCAVAEQRQSVTTPAPTVAHVLQGAGRDREAPARLAGGGINCHGVAAARHETASRQILDGPSSRRRVNLDMIGTPCSQTA